MAGSYGEVLAEMAAAARAAGAYDVAVSEDERLGLLHFADAWGLGEKDR